MKLDSIDIKIVDALLKDGRASFRDVAQETSLTTPTVSNHLSRLTKAGLIVKFVPLLNLDAIDQGIISIVTLKVPPSEVGKLAKRFSELGEVAGVYVTAEEHKIMLKVHTENMHELESFLARIVPSRGCEVVTSQIISSIVKDEQPIKLKSGISLEMHCDFCKGPISGNRPYTIKVGPASYYFCCRICRRSYLDKHGSRMEAIKSRAKRRKTS
ncbi:MAG: winged helix-turn-helix transcriptional regulator [Nitrososphaerales archaeon]|nr:winged helix-turn-helix transcriptional regulator [Nitrososphaerales archaeon]